MELNSQPRSSGLSKRRIAIERTIFQLVLNEPGSRRLRRIAGRLPAALDPALAPGFRANPATFLGSRTALILNGATYRRLRSLVSHAPTHAVVPLSFTQLHARYELKRDGIRWAYFRVLFVLPFHGLIARAQILIEKY